MITSKLSFCTCSWMGTPKSLIEWAMSELMRSPDTMKKAQAEVMVVKGNTITETDLQSVHYMKLVIKETLRLHFPPLLAPRVTRQHYKIDGYDIPANTNIVVMCGSVKPILRVGKILTASFWRDLRKQFSQLFKSGLPIHPIWSWP